MRTRRFYIDTNIFIILLETKGSAFESFVERTAAMSAMLVTSEITLAELLVRPLQSQDSRLVLSYEGLIISGEFLTIIPIDRNVLRASAQVRAQFPNKLPDAIHIATALQNDCQVLVSSDQRLKLPPELLQVTLDELDKIANS